jgi:citrate lyase subunit beta/citryl-CoA lyase
MLDKARSLPADEVFIDLEDAVVPDEKTDATRQDVVDALLGGDWVAPTRAVRINGVATRWCWQDLVYLVPRAGRQIDCVVVPKVHDADHVHFVDHLLSQLELQHGLEVGRIALEILIETPHASLRLEQIASASRRIEALVFGPGDYAASCGIPQLTIGSLDPEYPGDQWHYIHSRLVTTARAFGLQAIDGPFAQIHDIAGLIESARRARLLGMDGKWALHPKQIDVLNDVYRPTQAQFDRAEAIIARYRKTTEVDRLGATMLDGEMIDEASRKMAAQVSASGRAAGMAPSPAVERVSGA